MFLTEIYKTTASHLYDRCFGGCSFSPLILVILFSLLFLHIGQVQEWPVPKQLKLRNCVIITIPLIHSSFIHSSFIPPSAPLSLSSSSISLSSSSSAFSTGVTTTAATAMLLDCSNAQMVDVAVAADSPSNIALDTGTVGVIWKRLPKYVTRD